MEVALPGTEHAEPRPGWSFLRGGVLTSYWLLRSYLPTISSWPLSPNLILGLKSSETFRNENGAMSFTWNSAPFQRIVDGQRCIPAPVVREELGFRPI